MKPPILLMDGVSDPDEATWVEFYDTIEDIRRELEPWFVDEPHVILDANGARLDIVRRKYGPSEQVDLELLAQAPRPDIVRKFVVKELLSAASGHGSVPDGLDSRRSPVYAASRALEYPSQVRSLA